MSLADREWRLVREEAWSGPMNMALDEVAAATVADGGAGTVRVYRWDPGTLSLGYRQAYSSVDRAFCEREGISVTRRPTGGGGIYHDAYGDISYTVVAPADDLPENLLASYELLCEPVLDAFDRMGIDAGFAEETRPALHEPACYLRELHPAHDVVVAGADGERKISGNAQHRREDVIVQHGSLTYDLWPRRHLGTFADPETTPEAFAERVTSIREQAAIPRRRAVAALEAALRDWVDAEEDTWTPDEIEAARDRAARKYASDAWTRDREDPLS